MWPLSAMAKLCSGDRRQTVFRLHDIFRASTQASHLGVFATVRFRTRPAEDTERKMIVAPWIQNRQEGRLGLVTSSFGCSSSVLWTHELEQDFDAEPRKHARSYSNQAVSDVCGQRMSVRIESPMVGILDKELVRKCRTQPFTEMQSLGVPLYCNNKLRNHKCFSTSAMESNSPEDCLGCTCSTNSSNTLIEADAATMPNEKITLDEEDDEIGVLDTDSEEDDHDYNSRNRPSISSMIKEESIEALELTLKEMEKSLPPDDVRIGTTCLRLAQLYDSADEEPEEVLPFAEKALKILEAPKEGSFDVAICYHVLGSTYYKMDESEKAVTYLEQAADLLDKLREAEANSTAIGTIKYAGQVLLGHLRMALGKQEDGIKNYERALAINEKILEPGNPDLARSYQQAAEAYTEAGKHQEALSLCLKALPIYENFYGAMSFEVAVLRRLMAMIHDDLDDQEKLLYQHDIIRPILVKLGKMKEVASLDLASGEALMSLERFKDATLKFKEVVKETKESSRFHGHALVMLGKAYAELKQGKNSIKYCKKAHDALKGKKLSLEAGSSLMELASVFQQLNELDQALMVLKKALTVFEEFPDEVGAIAEIEGQVGLLYVLMGKVEQGLPYLEKSAINSEEIYGKNSEELLAVYNHTAIAYLELGRFEEALVKFEAARSIAVENYGQDDGDTIAIYSNLANTYAGLERFEKAIEWQKQVVDAVKRGKTNYDVPLAEAEKKLEDLILQAKSSESIERRNAD